MSRKFAGRNQTSSIKPQNIPTMKRASIIIAIILFSVRCSNKLAITELKDYRSIEGVKIGMSINSAVESAKKKFFVEATEIPAYEEQDPVYLYTVYEDKTKKQVLFSFNAGHDKQTKDKVFRLVIMNPRYHIIDDIFVGITAKELKEKTRLKEADFNYDDGLFLISGTFDGGFLMDLSTLKDKNYNYEQPQISTLPGELKVKEIIIF